jgi:phosphoribosylanthranilate isomerase
VAEFLLPRVKVCGVRRFADIEVALGLEARDASGAPNSSGAPDAIGLVAWRESPRFVDARVASEIVRRLPASILPVAVMVDVSPRAASEWSTAAGCRAVQLCGAEEPSEWRGFPSPILRRVAVDRGARVELAAWRGIAAGFVLDHPSAHGGTGIGVDLDLAAELSSAAPCLLAGGLDAENVAERIARVRPWGVDASSRLETAPGVKDPERVAAFVCRARSALARTNAPLESERRS